MMEALLPLSIGLTAINGGYIVTVPKWVEGDLIDDFHTFASLNNALSFIKRTIKQLDSDAKTADDEEPAEVDTE